MRNTYRYRSLLCLLLTGLTHAALQAQGETKTLPSFDKIIASQFVELELREGTQESVRLEYTNIEPEKMNCVVKGKTLRLYLDDAKWNVKNRKWRENGKVRREPIYRHVRVKAYVTYRTLRKLEARGEEPIVCLSPIKAERFRLRLMGEIDLRMAALEADYLKASLFGENKVFIDAGRIHTQRYRAFGENQVDTRRLRSQAVYTSTFGQSRFDVRATSRIKVVSFGESEIYYAGNPRFSKGLVLGDFTSQKISGSKE